MPSVVVDTNVVSFCFKGDTRAAGYEPHLAGKLLVLSFMTVAELDLWALERRWGQARKQRMENYIRRFVIYPYNRVLCEKWAEVKRQTRRKGREIDTADAWIAATALMSGVPLVSHNPADFS